MIDLSTGARLFVETEGAGPPLLVIHGGLGLDHSYFQPWFDPLQSGFQVIYPDMRGNGRSAAAFDPDFTIEKMADDLEALRISLGLKQWAVLGHSYGGFIAQAYALKYPEAVSHLILVDTSPAPALILGDARAILGPKMNQTIGQASFMLGKLANRTAPEGGDEEFKTLWHYVLPLYFDSFAIERLISDDKTVYREHAFVVGAQRTFGLDNRPALAKLMIPTLVVVGRQDGILPMAHSEALANAIPKAKLVVFEDSGHFPFIEERDHFVEVVRGFLAE